jgi:hypothetical protein
MLWRKVWAQLNSDIAVFELQIEGVSSKGRTLRKRNNAGCDKRRTNE